MKKLKILFYFVKEYLTVISLMIGVRGLFLLVNFKEAQDFNTNLILKSFIRGLIFDTSIISYYLIGFILCFILFRFFKSIYLEMFGKIFLKIYKVIVSAIIFSLMFSDIRYYKEFNVHLDSSTLNYVSHLKEIFFLGLKDRLAVILFIIFIFTEATYLIVSFKIFKNLEIDEKELKSKYHFNFKVSPFKRFVDVILEIILCLTVATFCIFGARGSFSKETLKLEKAYFSENYFANQVSLNGVFALFKNIKNSKIKKLENI
ncbi:hypothetical protein [Fusobacterium sp. MFO224]|uniref:hypothetical protein n=1 Tax=Fusobacterium sp. MFO224 TaxID=3378070 RepID=UPI003851BB80